MRIAVLGPLEVHVDGAPVTVRRGVPRVLLAAMLVRRPDVVPFDTLIDQVWGDATPANPTNALHTQIAYLRRTIVGLPLVTRPTGYVLEPEPGVVDSDRFEQLASSARTEWDRRTASSARRAHDAAVAALAEWRGEAYADVADRPFARGAAGRLEELRLAVEELRIDALLATGQPSRAAHELVELVDRHPLRERFHEQLMLALYRSGRQADALRAFAAARGVLVDELGVEPGAGLRDLERAVLDHAESLRWAPLPDDAVTVAGPAPSSAVPVPAAPSPPPLPHPSTPILGREAELARVAELHATARLVTLVGPGGAGKTRLALELARDAADRRTVHFIDLSVVPPGGDATTAIAAELDARLDDREALASALGAVLGDADALVVLDTCEHVIDGVRPVVRTILDTCPSVTVLATSRRPLSLAEELAWPVPPLGLPSGSDEEHIAASPAVRLFVERARAVRPDFGLDHSNAADVAEVCRAVDGLPLAIELAAAQSDVMSPAAIRGHLPDRFTVLVGRDPSTPPRQRTLSATIDWSLELVGGHEREVLAALAEFVGSFDVAAAASVAGCDEPDALRVVAELARQSVVAVEDLDAGRYRVLDSVRSRVLATVDGPARQAARTRHAAHFAALAESSFSAVRGRAQPAWMERFRLDVGNLRAALAWSFEGGGDPVVGARLASAMAWIWTSEGRLVEARAALERAAEVADAPPDVRARALLGIGLLAAPRGDLALARRVCGESASLSRELGDDFGVADALLTRGVAEWGLGLLEDAARSHDESIERFLRAGDDYSATVTRVLRARTELDRGHLDDADELLGRALDDARECGGDHVIGLALIEFARVAIARGDADLAATSAREAHDGFERIGYAEGIMSALNAEGRAALLAGDASHAHARHRRAAAIARAIGHPAGLCESLEAIAEVLAAAGDPARASQTLLHARRIRARREVPARPVDEADLRRLAERLHDRLGAQWDTVERSVRVASSDAFVDEMLTSVEPSLSEARC